MGSKWAVMIEILLFNLVALGWVTWEFVKTDRLLKKSKAHEDAQKEAQSETVSD
ncbi:MAG: hypothetical protein AAFR21_05580 [Pseudomonadota bacterium]